MSSIPLSSRLAAIEPFRVMEIMARANELDARGNDVVHFEVGEPDFPTAAPIAAAGREAIAAGRTRYTEALGMPALRRAIAGYYRDTLGVQVDAERVIVTAGASGGLLLLTAMLLDAGDELLVTDPGYPCNSAFAAILGARTVRMRLDEKDGFQASPARVADAWSERTRGVLLASPANPTGVTQSADSIEAIHRVVADRAGVLILDEIYQSLVYDDDVAYRTGLALIDGSDRLMVLNSFSKYFAMTGWRLGWVVVPEAYLDAINRLAQNLFISPPAIAQHAAMAAFTPEALAIHESRREAFRRRRDRLHDGLLELGLSVPVKPTGAFYLYADVSATGLDSREFCWRLLTEAHVAVTPGEDFGQADPHRFVRFAYTVDETRIDEALARIRRFVADL